MTTPHKGVLLGRSLSGKTLRYNGDRHLLTVSPNGGGKDVSVVTPNCIRHPGSLIVVDPKGESATLTAKWRAETLGQKVYVFDPFRVVPDECLPGPRARFNPIDLVRNSPDPVTISKMLAAALIIPDEARPHWGRSARSLLGGYICAAAFIRYYTNSRDFYSIWEDLNASNAPGVDEHGNPSPSLFMRALLEMTVSGGVAGGYPAREANRFLNGAQDEVRSIRSTLFSNCSDIFDDPIIMENLSETSLDFADIQKEPTTVYLCLPGYLSDTHSRWFRLLLTCMLAAIERSGLRDPVSTAPRTLWLLNEFATQKRNDVLLEALPRMRGYGCQFWIFVQDLNQLRFLYKDAWETFISNSGVIQVFGGPSDFFTLEYASKLTGQTTQTTRGTSVSTKPGSGDTSSTSMQGRPLFYPDQIRDLSASKGRELAQMLVISGAGQMALGAIEADRLLYYADFPDFELHRMGEQRPPEKEVW